LFLGGKAQLDLNVAAQIHLLAILGAHLEAPIDELGLDAKPRSVDRVHHFGKRRG